MHSMIAYFFWDPDPKAFTLPLLGHPIVWYGILFAFGFFLGYFVMRTAVTYHFTKAGKALPDARQLAARFADRLLWCTVIGTLIGARLGEVLFYGLPYYLAHPFEIFAIWNGGLASHGAAVGVLVSMVVFRYTIRTGFPKTSFLQLFDMITMPVALIAGFIRMGNFVNQEFCGTVTDVSWAVVFGHPAGLAPGMPRHPVQLYEAVTYLGLFALIGVLYRVFDFGKRRGFLAGLFLVMTFGLRFMLEFLKDQAPIFPIGEKGLMMQQLLDLPCVLAGVGLILYSFYREAAPVVSDSSGK